MSLFLGENMNTHKLYIGKLNIVTSIKYPSSSDNDIYTMLRDTTMDSYFSDFIVIFLIFRWNLKRLWIII